jgi:hypothetical protein
VQVAVNLSSLSAILSQAQYLHVVHIATRSSLSVAVFRDTVDVLVCEAKKIIALAQHNQSDGMKRFYQTNILDLLFPDGTEEPADVSTYQLSLHHLPRITRPSAWGIDIRQNPDYWPAGPLARPTSSSYDAGIHGCVPYQLKLYYIPALCCHSLAGPQANVPVTCRWSSEPWTSIRDIAVTLTMTGH